MGTNLELHCFLLCDVGDDTVEIDSVGSTVTKWRSLPRWAGWLAAISQRNYVRLYSREQLNENPV